MDKPLLQERLSEDEIQDMFTTWTPFKHHDAWKLLVEVKRLQAIEDRYKQTLELIASMEPHPAMARAKAKHALKGAVNHE